MHFEYPNGRPQNSVWDYLKTIHSTDSTEEESGLTLRAIQFIRCFTNKNRVCGYAEHEADLHGL